MSNEGAKRRSDDFWCFHSSEKDTIEDSINKPSDSARQFCLTEPYHLLGAAKTDKIRDFGSNISCKQKIYPFKRLAYLKETLKPDAFLSISPEWHHLVDLERSCGVGASSSCLKRTILHFRQEVFREGATHIVLISILWFETIWVKYDSNLTYALYNEDKNLIPYEAVWRTSIQGCWHHCMVHFHCDRDTRRFHFQLMNFVFSNE